MTALALFAVLWAIPLVLAVVVVLAACRAAGRADERVEAWRVERERARCALEAMGDEADGVWG